MQSLTNLFFTSIFALCLPFALHAQFEGVWKTQDDQTGEEKSYIKISVNEQGQLEGRITKLLTVDESTLCYTCKEEHYNKPLMGMKILWDFEMGNNGKPSTGKIMDPENGKTYSCKLDLANGGKTLKVRGYIGTPMLGRTQKWERLNL